MDYGLLGGLGEGLKAGLQGYMDMEAQKEKKRELDAKISAEKQDKVQKGYELELKAGEQGYEVQRDEGGLIKGLTKRQGFIDPNTQKRRDENLARGFIPNEQGNISLDPTGQPILAKFKQDEIGNKGLLQQNKLAQQNLGAATELRKEAQARPEVKQFQAVSSGYNKMLGAVKNPSAAGDMSLIYGFMKMQDPESSIKEGEYASAEQAAGVDDRLITLYNKAKDGQILSPNQRKDFLSQAKSLYNVNKTQYDALTNRYKGLSTKYGVDPSMVIDEGMYAVEPQQAAPQLSPQDQQAIQWANSNPKDPRAVQIKQRLGM